MNTGDDARTFPVPVDGALVTGVAAGLFVGVVCGDGAAVRVGVEQEERLEVVLDAFADHVFPPGANLQQTDEGQPGEAKGTGSSTCWEFDVGANTTKNKAAWSGKWQNIFSFQFQFHFTSLVLVLSRDFVN